VRVSVAGELVALRGDRADEVGVALGGHAEDEEGRLCVQLVEELEDRRGLALEGLAALVPIIAADAAVHELVPVLEVDRE